MRRVPRSLRPSTTLTSTIPETPISKVVCLIKQFGRKARIDRSHKANLMKYWVRSLAPR